MLASELVILRYAEADCDLLGVVGGENGDTGITRAGRIQAACAASQMALEPAEQPYSVVYAGGRRRLAETAQVIAAVLGTPVRRETTLGGQRYGADIDGRPWTEVVAALGGRPPRVPDKRLGIRGETWHQYVTRLERVLRRLTERHPGQRIVVIGENATVDASFRLFLSASGVRVGLADTEFAPTGLTRWREQPIEGLGTAAGLHWSLVLHNSDRHLPQVARLFERQP
jgi:2,3-bisphosphoglycerate-dependent phosphoglycerate mutase